MMKMPEILTIMKGAFVEKPCPISGLETIQLLFFREVLDYTVLRTEDDREVNVATTVKSIKDTSTEMTRSIFLGSKQKAVESRQLERMLRTAANEAQMPIEECYLKDHLCLACPRCILYGGSNASMGKGKKSKANIKHRVSYSTAFSSNSAEEVREAITFNAISDSIQSTGQALGERIAVKPGTLFPSIVTLTSVTWIEFILVLKAILSAHRYGAESRVGGDVRNHLVGIVSGWEEIITSLEFTLELAAEKNFDEKTVETILSKYKKGAANPEKVVIVPAEKIPELLDGINKVSLDKNLLEEAFDQVKVFRELQGESV